jgi:sulfide:quinone oxidoreductase
MFGVPIFAEALDKLRKQRGIEVLFGHKLTKVDAANRKAFLSYTDPNGNSAVKEVSYDLLHVVPTQSAHDFVVESGLVFDSGDQKGWLAVDKYSFQHVKYPKLCWQSLVMTENYCPHSHWILQFHDGVTGF